MWKHRLVTDQQRRLHKRKRLRSWWLWLRRPIVLTTAFQTVRLITELIRAVRWW